VEIINTCFISKNGRLFENRRLLAYRNYYWILVAFMFVMLSGIRLLFLLS